jgi:hypothetical protein
MADRNTAIRNTHPSVKFIGDYRDEDGKLIEENGVWDLDYISVTLDESAITTEEDRLDAEVANEYARNRKAEYPDWSVQLEKIYDDGLTKWKAEMVDPVKTKWPKDNSGPIE